MSIEFDKWWIENGIFIDTDPDASWFDKRRDFAELAFNAAGMERQQQEWIKATAHETYDGLKKQFQSMKALVNSMGQQVSYYSKKSYETGEKHLAELTANLESERDMNAKLTEELQQLSQPEAQAGDVQKLKKSAHELCRTAFHNIPYAESTELVDMLIDDWVASGHLRTKAEAKQ